jgi:hypothetical protein
MQTESTIESVLATRDEQVVAPDGKSVPVDSAGPQIPGTFRICLKRSQLIDYVHVDAGSHIVAIPISSLFAHAIPDDASATFRKSSLAYYASMFRIWRCEPVFTIVGKATVLAVYRPGNSIDFDYSLLEGPSTNALHYRGPLDISRPEEGVMVVRTPFTTIYKSLLLPKRSNDSTEEYNCGTLVLRIQDMESAVSIFANLGDFGRFALRYGVPRLVVRGLNTPPDTYTVPGGVFTLPNLIRVDHLDSADRWLPPTAILGAPAAIIAVAETRFLGAYPERITSVSADPRVMTVAQLNALGILITSGNTRAYDGSTLVLERNLNSLCGVADITTISYNSLFSVYADSLETANNIKQDPPTTTVDGYSVNPSISVDYHDITTEVLQRLLDRYNMTPIVYTATKALERNFNTRITVGGTEYAVWQKFPSKLLS